MAVEPAADENIVSKLPVQRLCNEIQLFDLCDLERCSFKKERFCTNADLLKSFERIADAEIVRREVYTSEDSEEGEDAADEEYDDEFEDDGYGDRAEYEDED